MYLMAGLLVIGFFCNLAVRPVDRAVLHECRRARGRASEASARPSGADAALHKHTLTEYCCRTCRPTGTLRR